MMRIRCWTLKAAKKYDQTLRVHFCGRLRREKQDEERTGSERQRANEQIEFQAELRH
jgi:hypothetical protein